MSDLYELEAKYEVHSCWELDFDVKDVHAWWIKYDRLYVIHQDGEDIKEYPPTYSGRTNDLKRAEVLLSKCSTCRRKNIIERKNNGTSKTKTFWSFKRYSL